MEQLGLWEVEFSGTTSAMRVEGWPFPDTRSRGKLGKKPSSNGMNKSSELVRNYCKKTVTQQRKLHSDVVMYFNFAYHYE